MSILKRLVALLGLAVLLGAVFWTLSSRIQDAPNSSVASQANAAPASNTRSPALPYPPPTPALPPTPRPLPPYPITSPTPTSPFPTLTPPTALPTLTLGPANPLPTIAPPVAAGSSTLHYATMTEGATPWFAFFDLRLGADHRPVGPATARPLPAAIQFNPYETWPSPTGNYIVLMEPTETGGLPHIVNRTTGAVNSSLRAYGPGNFYGWHPDGRQFLFWIYGKGLWLIDAETLDRSTLATPEGPVQGAALSPDGKMVAYIARNMPATRRALWLVSSTGGDAQPLLDVGGVAYMYSRAWAPDSRRLLFAGACAPQASKDQASLSGGGGPSPSTSGGPWCIVDVKTRALQPLSRASASYEPTWSPDGRTIALTGLSTTEAPCPGGKSGPIPDDCRYIGYAQYKGQAIYTFDLLTGQAQELTPGLAPVWSPDGSSLAFLSNRSGASEVWSLDMRTRETRQLSSDGQPKNHYTLMWLREAQP